MGFTPVSKKNTNTIILISVAYQSHQLQQDIKGRNMSKIIRLLDFQAAHTNRRIDVNKHIHDAIFFLEFIRYVCQHRKTPPDPPT
jgi:hypothetical protein